MKTNSVTVRCRIDKKTFLRFALFDTFRLKKHGRLPVLFFLIMLAFSLVCFFSGKSESGLLGGVLLLLGIGMPAVYVGSFLSGVKKQADKLKLDRPRPMYTLMLDPDGITVRNDYKAEENVSLSWDRVWGAVRVRGAVYLYATPARAFILPEGQSEPDDDALFRLLSSCLPKNKLTDKR